MAILADERNARRAQAQCESMRVRGEKRKMVIAELVKVQWQLERKTTQGKTTKGTRRPPSYPLFAWSYIRTPRMPTNLLAATRNVKHVKTLLIVKQKGGAEVLPPTFVLLAAVDAFFLV
jgi:hypothetical protein